MAQCPAGPPRRAPRPSARPIGQVPAARENGRLRGAHGEVGEDEQERAGDRPPSRSTSLVFDKISHRLRNILWETGGAMGAKASRVATAGIARERGLIVVVGDWVVDE